MDPIGVVDTRFSQPEVEATPWSVTLGLIESAELFFLSTVRVDGRPHVTPLVGQWLDGALHFSTGDREQKFRNLEANPHVVLTTGSNDWDHGIDVVVEGRAERVRDDEQLRRLAKAWAGRWNGQWDYEVRDGNFSHPGEESHEVVAVFSVKPSRVLAFSKGPYIHTTYRFA